MSRYLLDNFKPAQVHLIPGDWRLKNPISENTLNTALKRMGYEGQPGASMQSCGRKTATRLHRTRWTS